MKRILNSAWLVTVKQYNVTTILLIQPWRTKMFAIMYIPLYVCMYVLVYLYSFTLCASNAKRNEIIARNLIWWSMGETSILGTIFPTDRCVITESLVQFSILI